MMAGKKGAARTGISFRERRRRGIVITAVISACLGAVLYTVLFFIQEYRKSNVYWGAIPMQFILLSAAVFIVTAGGFLFVWWYPHRYERTRIAELTDYLEEINVGGTGTVLSVKEDEFSHLQDEMYKTVTELYHTREQAIVAKENYADNLANIAHQLKTPVTAAFLSLQLLEQVDDITEESDKEKVKNNVTLIKKQLERLQYLEEALLTLSRIDAGVLRLECAQVDIYTVLSLAADNLDNLLSGKNVSVSIPDKGSVTFQGDMEWTMEALMNLMKNCMEHSPEGGTIYCDYSVNPLYKEIRIWDEGTGFDKEDIPHLFERFYRGKNIEKAEDTEKNEANEPQRISNDTGVGIGLSLARSILEQQNGTISARNLPQGGACFEIKIYSH
ncbi:MAG: HAMP domain-containing histidine kinase [Lachnospiraceae bacterium]|nr:HAMP domain-containing histidine kinase [Lachnospiraceae bacterium]